MDYSVFEFCHWNERMGYHARLLALQELENTMAQEQKRANSDGKGRVVVDKILPVSTDGCYDDNVPNCIFINKTLLDDVDKSYRAMDTVIHEGRHAYQDDLIVAYINGIMEECKLKKKPIKTIESWIKNSIVRYEFTGEFPEYAQYIHQPRENDAHYYAYKKMKKIQSIEPSLSSDEKYSAYLAKILDDYTEVWKKEAEKRYKENYIQNIEKEIIDIYNKLISKYGIFLTKEIDIRKRYNEEYPAAP